MGWNGQAWDLARQALAIVDAHPAAGDADTLHFLGTSLMQSNNEADALPVLRRAAALNPHNAATWVKLGEAAEFMGLADEAEAGYEQAIAAGQHTSAHLSLAPLAPLDARTQPHRTPGGGADASAGRRSASRICPVQGA